VTYDAGSCGMVTEILSVSIIGAPGIDPLPVVSVCNTDNAFDLTALGITGTPSGGTFTFSDAGGLVNSATGIFDATTLADGTTYNIDVVYDAGSCGDVTETLVVSIIGSPTLTINNTPDLCPDSSVDLNTIASGFTINPTGGSFSFRNPSAGSINGANIFNASGLSSADNPVTVEVVYDINGCAQAIELLTINILDTSDPACSGGGLDCFAFTTNIDAITRPDCEDDNGAFQLTITGTTNSGIQVIFETDTGLGSFTEAAPGNTIVINGDSLSAGIYRYTISDGVGNVCPSTDSFVELRTQTSVEAVLMAGTVEDVTCFGGATGSVKLDSLSDPTSFTSIDGGVSWQPLGVESRVENLPAGDLRILVGGDAFDPCPVEIDVTINSTNPEIMVDFTPMDASCANNDGSIEVLSVSGGTQTSYAVSLEDDGGNVVYASLPSDDTFRELEAGDYFIRIVDEGLPDCERSIPVTISFPGALPFTIQSIEQPSCVEPYNDGSFSVLVTGGNGAQVDLRLAGTDDILQTTTVNAIGIFSFFGLTVGSYEASILPVGGSCPAIVPININAGPVAISFDAPQIFCLGGRQDQRGLLIENITGDFLQPFLLRVFDQFGDNVLNPSEELTLRPDSTAITGAFAFLNRSGEEFFIEIFQDQQPACTEVSFVHPDALRPPANISAEVLETTQSLPDRFTGTLTLGNFSGGFQPEDSAFPWSTSIELDEAFLPGVSFSTDFEVVEGEQQRYEDLPPGVYNIMVIDQIGCALELTATVELNTDIFIPNVFTPNGDDTNELFFIRNLPPTDSGSKMLITNRWGKVVFDSDNYYFNTISDNSLWDGGDEPDGVYFYTAEIEGETFKGWVEIVRGQP
ncbi:MAG: gliding motility-associated C-terminal domain-containing protein, partial [Bacteroidota bacterium]